MELHQCRAAPCPRPHYTLPGPQAVCTADCSCGPPQPAASPQGEGKTRVILPMLLLHYAAQPVVVSCGAGSCCETCAWQPHPCHHLFVLRLVLRCPPFKLHALMLPPAAFKLPLQVRLVLLPQLLAEAYSYMHACLCASSLARKLYLLPFHRDVRPTPQLLSAMRSALEHCTQVGWRGVGRGGLAGMGVWWGGLRWGARVVAGSVQESRGPTPAVRLRELRVCMLLSWLPRWLPPCTHQASCVVSNPACRRAACC